MIRFNILGSCVCRDVFNYDSSGEFLVNRYVNGISALSLQSKFSNITLSFESLKLRSNFERRCAWLDFNKAVYDYIKDPADWLVISLSDNRIDLAEIFSKKTKQLISSVTWGTTFRENYAFGISELSETFVKAYKPFDIPRSFYAKAILDHADQLLKLFPADKIIVVEDYFVDKYVTAEGEICSFNNSEYVNNVNLFYKFLYSELYQKISNFIIQPPINNIADKTHKLGLFGLHFVPEYYEYVLEVVKAIVRGKFSAKVALRNKEICERKIFEKYNYRV